VCKGGGGYMVIFPKKPPSQLFHEIPILAHRGGEQGGSRWEALNVGSV
jgi:hypothetical protein